MLEHVSEVRVRWSDADPAGIAFYPRFFEWFDLGTEALFAAVGLRWAELFPRHRAVGVPVLEVGSRFRSPVRYGDVVTVRSRVAWVRDRAFRVEHELSVDGRLCAEGFEVRAWVDLPATPGARLSASPLPPEVAAGLRGEGGPAGASR